jgi:hypothetical protein
VVSWLSAYHCGVLPWRSQEVNLEHRACFARNVLALLPVAGWTRSGALDEIAARAADGKREEQADRQDPAVSQSTAVVQQIVSTTPNRDLGTARIEDHPAPLQAPSAAT